MENFSCSNASSDGITESYWSLEGENAITGYVTANFLLLYILVGMPWNILVLVTIVKEKLYDQPSIILLLNLTIIDILFLLFSTPASLAVGYAGEFILGSSDFWRCRICSLEFFRLICLYISLFTITLMSADRFLYIYKPLQYERIVSTKGIVISIVISWIFCIVLIGVIPRLLPSHDIMFIAVLLTCTINTPFFFAIILMIICFAAVIVIVVSNVLIVRAVLKNLKVIYVRRRSQATGQLSNNDSWSRDRSKTRRAKQLHLFRIFAALLLSSIMTWVPFIGATSSIIIFGYDDVSNAGISLCLIIFQSQPVVHPVIQTVFIADVRRPLKKIVERIFCKHLWMHSTENDNALDTRKGNWCTKCSILAAINEAIVLRMSHSLPKEV